MITQWEFNGIEYGKCEQDDLEDLIKLLAYNFSKYDPPPQAMGIREEEFADFVRVLMGNADRVDMTLIARSEDNGKLAGVSLNEDASAPVPADIDKISPKFDPIFGILEELNQKYWADKNPTKGSFYHIFLLGVDETFTGRKIAQQLVRFGLKQAEEAGFTMVVTEATNSISQHIFRQLGFEDRVLGSYRDYRFEGRPVFGSIEGHSGPHLMDKRL